MNALEVNARLVELRTLVPCGCNDDNANLSSRSYLVNCQLASGIASSDTSSLSRVFVVQQHPTRGSGASAPNEPWCFLHV